MNEVRIPEDACNLISGDLINRANEANKDVDVINEIMADFDEAEPEFTAFVRAIARRHVNVMKKRMAKNPVKALESLCMKFAAISWDATLRSLRSDDILKLEKSFDMTDMPLFDSLEEDLTEDTDETDNT